MEKAIKPSTVCKAISHRHAVLKRYDLEGGSVLNRIIYYVKAKPSSEIHQQETTKRIMDPPPAPPSKHPRTMEPNLR
jgi:hypothetical protein